MDIINDVASRPEKVSQQDGDDHHSSSGCWASFTIEQKDNT